MVNHSSQAAQATQSQRKTTRQRSEASQPSQTSNQKVSKQELKRESGRKLAQRLAEKRARGETIKKAVSKSKKAGIFFPVSKFLNKMKKANPRLTVRSVSSVLLTSVIEYLVAEILELAGNVSSQFHRKRITPRDIFLAIKTDEEFEKYFANTTLMQGGVIPRIHPDLIGTKKSRSARLKTENKEEKSVPLSNERPSQTSTPKKRKITESNQDKSNQDSSKRVKH